MSSIFTKKELTNLSWRHQFGLQLGHNYARMQGLGYYYSIYPALAKIYKDDPEALKKACQTQCMYYNTTPQMSEIIMGMDVAIEEKEGIAGLESVVALKTSLMGPFAAVGDVIFSTISGTIFGAIAGNMAVEGSPAGMFIWMAWYIAVILIRPRLFMLGYNKGTDLISGMTGTLEKLTNGAGIVGLMVVGGLITTAMGFSFTVNFKIGEVAINLQSYLDKIVPKLPQILLTLGIFKLSGRKGMTTSKLIFAVMIVGFILGALKIIG